MKKLENIDFLIFDLGNVIIDIDYDFSIRELKKILPNEKHYLTADFFPSSFHKDYEKGMISSDQFRNAVRELYQENFSNEQIDHIWNSLLKDIPQERIDLVRNLNQDFGTAVLSNTNEIHILKFNEILNAQTSINGLSEMFDRVFLSHEMGLAKPDEAIYKAVINEIQVEPNRVLFFDDLLANLEGAKRVGLQTFHITHPKALIQFFADVH
jgi:HAD superfamily hydrolase (TIGR01509 family)